MKEEKDNTMAEVFRQQQRALLGLGGPETMDAETLVNTPLAAMPFVVSELIPQGLHMIGGAAKIGKSWLMLWLGLRIAKGEPIWNYECKQGTVLYLALEDSYERLQRRLLDLTDEGSPHLHCAVVCKTLADGFCQEIDAFMAENPSTRMIIVDTFQKIRGDGAGNTNPYAHDYQELSMLKELAAKHGIAILLVHHLRKQGANDPVNTLTGSTGIAGAVDSTFAGECPRTRALLMTSILMGLRRGEVVALKWEDIDFKNHSLSVNKSAYKEKGKPQALKAPKSQNSVRTVYFSDIYATSRRTSAILKKVVPTQSCLDTLSDMKRLCRSG